jgi:hypothetical protein
MALSIPIISEFNGKGIDKAIKEFKQLEGAGKKAQFALKKGSPSSDRSTRSARTGSKGRNCSRRSRSDR